MVSGVGIGVGTAAGIVGALIVAWHGLTWYEVDYKCEKPKYALLKKFGTRKDYLGRTRPLAELRVYAPVLAAEVTLSGMDMRDALSSGFRQIAGFIFGKNIAPTGEESQKVAMTSPVTLEATSQKIAMTAPVTAEASQEDSYKVTFIMPSHYTKDTLPKPKNENVGIIEVPARTMAALQWRGRSPSEETTRARAAELKAAMKEAGLVPKGNMHLWQYHPPFAPAWMRRNEVLFEVEESPAATTS